MAGLLTYSTVGVETRQLKTPNRNLRSTHRRPRLRHANVQSPAILVTTNLPFDEWTEVFGSERLTGALLDRLTHHVHILEMNGDSYRLKGSRQSPAALAPASDRPAAD